MSQPLALAGMTHLLLLDDPAQHVVRRLLLRPRTPYARGQPFIHEQNALAKAFSVAGYRSFCTDPRELKIEHGRLCAHGEEIDIVYGCEIDIQ